MGHKGQQPLSEALLEVVEDRRNLEELFGGIIRDMAYPYGSYNSALVNMLSACGISYARTIGCTNDFSLPYDWLRLKATCHHSSAELMKLADRFVSEQPELTPWLFYLWGHSYEFEQCDNRNVIEEFCKTVGGKDKRVFTNHYPSKVNTESSCRVQKDGRLTVDVSIACKGRFTP